VTVISLLTTATNDIVKMHSYHQTTTEEDDGNVFWFEGSQALPLWFDDIMPTELSRLVLCDPEIPHLVCLLPSGAGLMHGRQSSDSPPATKCRSWHCRLPHIKI
jgi:hypothetical protein